MTRQKRRAAEPQSAFEYLSQVLGEERALELIAQTESEMRRAITEDKSVTIDGLITRFRQKET